MHRAESHIVPPWYDLRQVSPLFSIICQKRRQMLEKMRHSKVLFEFTVTMTFSVSMRIFMRILPWIRFRHFPRCQNIFIYHSSDHSTLNGHKTIRWPQISNCKYLKLCNPALLRSPLFFTAIIPSDVIN
jgi:hypothetical protein